MFKTKERGPLPFIMPVDHQNPEPRTPDNLCTVTLAHEMSGEKQFSNPDAWADGPNGFVCGPTFPINDYPIEYLAGLPA